MKLLRTIRFDATDERVFELAAGPDEWAVSGAFAFAALDRSAITGTTRQAFAHGFLSMESFGRSTFVSVAETDDETIARLTDGLARHLVDAWGAPDIGTARPAAREEIDFAVELCRDAPVNTVFAVSRSFDEEGRIREAFRSVAPPGEPAHARIWDVIEE